MQSWSIIIFVFNEEAAIEDVVNKSIDVITKLNPSESEIIIVDDGSTDNTAKILNKFTNMPKIRIIRHDKNKGIGEALLTGYKHASFENICAIPGDGQFNPEELLPFSNIEPNTIISFYRTQKTRYTLFRKVLSFTNKFLNRYFLKIKIKDVNWIKVYKKTFFYEITPVLTSSLVESEICAKMVRKGYKIIEVKSFYHPRLGGKPKGASLKTIIQATKEILKLYLVLNRLK